MNLFRDETDPPSNPYATPQGMEQSASPPDGSGDATGGLIPYKNPYALTAYYLSIFGLFPCLGIVLSIPAVVLGVMGLNARKANPAIKGSVHAWIGICLGGFCTLCHIAGILLLIIGAVAG
ncbi:MAG: hypothetical protein WD045_12275 [Pirellulaceae bacterium]